MDFLCSPCVRKNAAGFWQVYAYDEDGKEWAYMYETGREETAQRWAETFCTRWEDGKEVDWAFWDMTTSAEDM
jgi:RimJ/RimL family protein N-acetyltransferase